LAREAGLDLLLIGKRMRQRLAPRNIAEFVMRSEIRLQTFDSLGQCRRSRIASRSSGPKSERRRAGRADTQEIPARQFSVFIKELLRFFHKAGHGNSSPSTQKRATA